MAAGPQPPPRMTIESGPYCFQCVPRRARRGVTASRAAPGVLTIGQRSPRSYIIENGVCYLTLTDRGYPKKLAFQARARPGPQEPQPSKLQKGSPAAADAQPSAPLHTTVSGRATEGVLPAERDAGPDGGEALRLYQVRCVSGALSPRLPPSARRARLRAAAAHHLHSLPTAASRRARRASPTSCSAARSPTPRSIADTFIQKTKKLYLDTRTQRNLNKLNEDLNEIHNIVTRNVQDVLGQGEKLDRAPTPATRSTLRSGLFPQRRGRAASAGPGRAGCPAPRRGRSLARRLIPPLPPLRVVRRRVGDVEQPLGRVPEIREQGEGSQPAGAKGRLPALPARRRGTRRGGADAAP